MATTPTEIESEALAAWTAFLRAHSTMLRRIARDLDDAGLPPLSWYDVLAALADAPDHHLRQVELAERCLISNSGLSRLLDRMQRDELVERRQCEEDRRAFYIALTDRGTEMLERMRPVYARGIVEDFVPALGANPCEIRKALEMMAACRGPLSGEQPPETAAS